MMYNSPCVLTPYPGGPPPPRNPQSIIVNSELHSIAVVLCKTTHAHTYARTLRYICHHCVLWCLFILVIYLWSGQSIVKIWCEKKNLLAPGGKKVIILAFFYISLIKLCQKSSRITTFFHDFLWGLSFHGWLDCWWIAALIFCA